LITVSTARPALSHAARMGLVSEASKLVVGLQDTLERFVPTLLRDVIGVLGHGDVVLGKCEHTLDRADRVLDRLDGVLAQGSELLTLEKRRLELEIARLERTRD
jgi:hypothetical protein